MSYTWCPEAYRVADPANACFDPVLWTLGMASLAGALILILAAGQDWVQRRASNAWWLLMLVPAAFTVAVEPVALASGFLGVVVGVAMWSARMGGADVKAVSVSAFLFPEPLVWAGAMSCVVIGAGVWWLLARTPVPFLVPLAAGLGTVLMAVAAVRLPIV